MKKYVQQSLMLSAIIFIIITIVSFWCYAYTNEMQLNALIVLIAFLCMGAHYITEYLFQKNFLTEIIFKFFLVEMIVLVIGSLCGWFIKSNWWMSLVYVTPAFLLAYLLGIIQIKKEVLEINEKLKERQKV